jgi:dUTP pyrophosphatase
MKFIQLHSDAIIPTRGTKHSAGYDLHCYETGIIEPNRRRMIPTGISWIDIPKYVIGHILPKSGLAHRHGIDTMAGVIDSDYRGEINIILYNTNTESFKFNKGDKLAQLLLQEYLVMEEEAIVSTVRNGGFGSTGR